MLPLHSARRSDCCRTGADPRTGIAACEGIPGRGLPLSRSESPLPEETDTAGWGYGNSRTSVRRIAVQDIPSRNRMLLQMGMARVRGSFRKKRVPLPADVPSSYWMTRTLGSLPAPPVPPHSAPCRLQFFRLRQNVDPWERPGGKPVPQIARHHRPEISPQLPKGLASFERGCRPGSRACPLPGLPSGSITADAGCDAFRSG